MDMKHLRQAKSILRTLANPSERDWVDQDGEKRGNPVSLYSVETMDGAGQTLGTELAIVLDSGEQVRWTLPEPVVRMVLKCGDYAILERSDWLKYRQAEHCDQDGFIPFASLGRGQDWEAAQDELDEYFDSLRLPRLVPTNWGEFVRTGSPLGDGIHWYANPMEWGLPE